MVMTKWFHKITVLFMLVVVPAGNRLQAQMLPVLNSFRGRTFTGTVDVSWPVAFDECVFITDSVVLNRSYGAVFRNCRFESRTGVLYMAACGDGMILADCEATGCKEVRFSLTPSLSDRNYITGVKVNGDECTVLDEQESIVDIDGLALSESVAGGSDGPLLMVMNADRKVLKSGETATVRIRGLEHGMFVGWLSSDPMAVIDIADEFTCVVTAPEHIDAKSMVVISAYTEYGLEAACELILMPEEIITHKRKR